MSELSTETTVRRLSANDIEALAEEIISQLAANTLNAPCKTPILEFIETATIEVGLLFIEDDLGMTNDGRKILGVFQQDPLAIKIDTSLADDDARHRFTSAHEYGHFVLHSDLLIRADVGLERSILDTKLSFGYQRKLVTARDWVEWQANYFAAAILIPRSTLRQAVETVQDRIGILNNRGSIIVEDKDYNIEDFRRQLGELCGIYIVSRKAMEIRLDQLGILIDRRLK